MMKSLKIISLSIALLFAAYCGTIVGIPGALNILLFFIWAIYLPIGLLALHPTIHKAIAETPPRPIASNVSSCINLITLGILIWTGQLATGIALGFYLFCEAVANIEAKKLRTKAAEA